jgi:hypothetical protein
MCNYLLSQNIECRTEGGNKTIEGNKAMCHYYAETCSVYILQVNVIYKTPGDSGISSDYFFK